MPENNKYLICPVCFSLYRLDNDLSNDIMDCEHCEDIETIPMEEFLYFSSAASLEELKEEFKRSSHLDDDVKELIISNIRILISLLEEIES